MLFLILYTTVLNENLFVIKDYRDLEESTQFKYNIAHEVFGLCMTGFALYFIVLES